jgi:CBS domain containing-hemolysin-like protein
MPPERTDRIADLLKQAESLRERERAITSERERLRALFRELANSGVLDEEEKRKALAFARKSPRRRSPRS